MNNELIVFLHNDLDAALCQLNFEFVAPNVRKKYFYTNYGDMSKKVDEIEHYQMIHKNTNILIMDVSFSTNKNELDRIYTIFNQITLIDHHLYSDNFWNNYNGKMKVYYDKSKCAALLSNEFFKNNGKHKNLDLLTKITDVYDLWKVDDKLFDFSQDLNNFFWELGMDKFCSEVIKNNYNLPNYYVETVNKINLRVKEGIEKLEQKNLIHRFGKITVIFSNDYFNDILIKEMKNGQDIVVNAMTYGIIRFRISKDASILDENKILLSQILTGEESIGHLNAFTYKIKETSFENIMNEIQRIVKETYRICY